MSDRDRLVELLKEADDATKVHDCDYPTYEKAMQAFYTSIADHLLANGVIVLPCAVGDTVYEVQEIRKRIQEYTVISVHYSHCSILFGWELKDGKGIYSNLNGFEESAIGKTIFLTPEEAEAKLAEMEGAE